MVQRIQTIYFALAIACLLSIFAFDINAYSADSGQYLFNVHGLFEADGAEVDFSYSLYLMLATGLACVVFLVALLQFKNRPSQIRMAKLGLLLSLGVIVAAVFLGVEAEDVIGSTINAKGYGVGFYLPIAAACFGLLAIRSVTKDHKLVKSLDRLR